MNGKHNPSTSVEPRLVRYAEARDEIRDADLLLFRRVGSLPADGRPHVPGRFGLGRLIDGLPSLPIAVAGRGCHCHAAKAAWWDRDLFCVEIRSLSGGRAVTLSSQVQRRPGRIDVYLTNPDDRWPDYDRAAAGRFMRPKARRPRSRMTGFMLLTAARTRRPAVASARIAT